MTKTTQTIILTVAAFSVSSFAVEPTYLEIKHPDGLPPKGAHFGNSVSILDFDADGHQDVAVAASGQSRVYIFFGPTFSRHKMFSPPGGAQQDHFGYDVAAGPVDSAPGDELIVSAPDRTGSPVARTVTWARNLACIPVTRCGYSMKSWSVLGETVYL